MKDRETDGGDINFYRRRKNDKNGLLYRTQPAKERRRLAGGQNVEQSDTIDNDRASSDDALLMESPPKRGGGQRGYQKPMKKSIVVSSPSTGTPVIPRRNIQYNQGTSKTFVEKARPTSSKTRRISEQVQKPLQRGITLFSDTTHKIDTQIQQMQIEADRRDMR